MKDVQQQHNVTRIFVHYENHGNDQLARNKGTHKYIDAHVQGMWVHMHGRVVFHSHLNYLSLQIIHKVSDPNKKTTHCGTTLV